MRLDPAGSEAGVVERPARPDSAANHSRVVDWFALTDSNLPEAPVGTSQAAPRPAETAAVAVPVNRVKVSWQALRAAARRVWQGRFEQRTKQAALPADLDSPAVGREP